MNLAFEDVLAFTRSWDAVYFTVMFMVAAVYAYWPRNKAHLEKNNHTHVNKG